MSSYAINLTTSGLDVGSIVDQLMAIERQPVTDMQTETTTLQNKVSAFQSLNTKLSTLLSKVNNLVYGSDTAPLLTPYAFGERLANSVFAGLKASSTNESVVSATGNTGTSSGTFAITVSSLAQAQSSVSANFADISTTRTGTGSIEIRVGNKDPLTVSIDGTNNTLDGVRQAINAANAGITATIVNDGTATPYRLLITADTGGTANAFTLTENLTGGQSLAMAQVQGAADALFSVNGIDIVKSTNTISDVIDGVTLNLKNKTIDPVTINVGVDVDGIVTSLKALVSAYNDVNSYVNSQSAYNATTQKAGTLSGDWTLRGVQTTIQSTLTSSVANKFTNLAVVGQVGLKYNSDGSLSIDESTLRSALSKNLTSVAALFLGDGTPPDSATATDARVSYNGKTEATQPGNYDIQITSLAQQASVASNRTVTNLLNDETLTITSGSTSSTVNLTAGDSLAALLTKINNGLKADGIGAVATDDGNGKIRFVTNAFGSSQRIAVSSNLGDIEGSTGFGTLPITGAGTDIAGTINGNAATGSGRVLSGAAGTPAEGLSLSIAQTSTGSYGSVAVTSTDQGNVGTSILTGLQNVLDGLTDPLSGPIQHATDSFKQNINILNDQITEYNYRLGIKQQQLTDQYNQADQALKMLTVNQSTLASLIAKL